MNFSRKFVGMYRTKNCNLNSFYMFLCHLLQVNWLSTFFFISLVDFFCHKPFDTTTDYQDSKHVFILIHMDRKGKTKLSVELLRGQFMLVSFCSNDKIENTVWTLVTFTYYQFYCRHCLQKVENRIEKKGKVNTY